MILHFIYGTALALAIFGLYRHPWIARALVELASLGLFVLALGVGAGYWTGVLQ